MLFVKSKQEKVSPLFKVLISSRINLSYEANTRDFEVTRENAQLLELPEIRTVCFSVNNNKELLSTGKPYITEWFTT